MFAEMEAFLQVEEATKVIQHMEIPPKPVVNIVHDEIQIVKYDERYNLLVAEKRLSFAAERIFYENPIFTAPRSTTNTLEGYLFNVNFHEQELIEEVIPDDVVVMYRCNYGCVCHPDYVMPTKRRTSNRGRKKKDKNVKPRKKQGNGTEFNSQLTFVVPNGEKEGTPVYKIKVFRTGKIQMPGVKPYQLPRVIAACNHIVDILNFHLHPGETNPAKKTGIANLNPVMKNYKFAVKIPFGYIIDQALLLSIIDAAPAPDAPPHPPIYRSKHSRKESKLSIKFSTPIYGNSQKYTRVNIFMRGRVNVLGALYVEVTSAICKYLQYLFEKYPVVVLEGRAGPARPFASDYESNIDEDPTDMRILRAAGLMRTPLAEL